MNKRRKPTKAEKQLRHVKNRVAMLNAFQDVFEKAQALELELLADAPMDHQATETASPVSD